MPFILANNALAQLDTLRADYENKKEVALDKPVPKIGRPLFLGGTDIKSRRAQISFLEKVKLVLQVNLIPQEDIKTQEQFDANLTASRAMLAACIYVKTQIPSIKSHSVLHELINDKLGISAANLMDQEDKEICYHAANRLFSSDSAFDKANQVLKTNGKKPFSDKEWNEFQNFLDAECNQSKSNNSYANFPVTSLTQPLFGAAFGYAGATAGALGGRLIGQSTHALSTQYKLTATLGGLLVLGPLSPSGVFLFAPVIAGKLINTFCSISLAHILGVAMGVVGQGVGEGVGLPFDLAYNILWKACSTIADYYNKDNAASLLSGVRISDGVIFVNGVGMRQATEEEISEGSEFQTINIETDGSILLNGKPVANGQPDKQLPKEVIDEIIQKIMGKAPVTPKVEETDTAAIPAI